MQFYPDDYPFNRFLFLELTFNYCHREREMKICGEVGACGWCGVGTSGGGGARMME
jgi:hypothetical protein